MDDAPDYKPCFIVPRISPEADYSDIRRLAIVVRELMIGLGFMYDTDWRYLLHESEKFPGYLAISVWAPDPVLEALPEPQPEPESQPDQPGQFDLGDLLEDDNGKSTPPS